MTVRVLSKWLDQQPTHIPMTDAQRHEAFATHAVNVANGNFPWLMPLLDGASATLYVGPSVFAFHLPANAEKWHEIPEMSRLIPMVPWVEHEEVAQ